MAGRLVCVMMSLTRLLLHAHQLYIHLQIQCSARLRPSTLGLLFWGFGVLTASRCPSQAACSPLFRLSSCPFVTNPPSVYYICFPFHACVHAIPQKYTSAHNKPLLQVVRHSLYALPTSVSRPHPPTHPLLAFVRPCACCGRVAIGCRGGG